MCRTVGCSARTCGSRVNARPDHPTAEEDIGLQSMDHSVEHRSRRLQRYSVYDNDMIGPLIFFLLHLERSTSLQKVATYQKYTRHDLGT